MLDQIAKTFNNFPYKLNEPVILQKNWLIGLCLMSTLTVFQLYHGMKTQKQKQKRLNLEYDYTSISIYNINL
jgi:hypothetical protein